MFQAVSHLVDVLDASEGEVDVGVELVVLVPLSPGFVGHRVHRRTRVDHVNH